MSKSRVSDFSLPKQIESDILNVNPTLMIMFLSTLTAWGLFSTGVLTILWLKLVRPLVDRFSECFGNRTPKAMQVAVAEKELNRLARLKKSKNNMKRAQAIRKEGRERRQYDFIYFTKIQFASSHR